MKSVFALLVTATAIFATTQASARDQVGLNAGPSMTGIWTYNGTHVFYLAEDRDGSLHGSVLVDPMPNYEAKIDMHKVGPGAYAGTGSQWYALGGCVETYFATYTMIGPDRARVELNGSTGDCGVPRDVRFSYEIRRAPPGMSRHPLNGVWVLNNTHRFVFNEDDFGGATGMVAVPSIPGYHAEIDVQATFPGWYEGWATQSTNGCTEGFNARYVAMGPNRIRVFVLGSDGACGTPQDIHLSYDIVRGR